MSVRYPPPQRANHDDQHSQRGASRSIGNYVLGRTIGEGTFGKVKLARHILSGQGVAVKVLQKDRLVEAADVERVAREVHILKLMRHPHIAQLFEVIETRGQLYLIMEYASGGELFDYIVKQGRVQEQEACRFFHQIIAGIERVHAMGVVHRDLKPENLLLDEHKCIKIVDFGLSNLFREGQRLSTACGSPCYAPPEMVAGQQYVPQLCDFWSSGVILFALVCGFLPFEDQNTAALYKKILAADFAFPNFPSEAVRELITGLLTVDPSRRFTIPAVRAHRWYQQIPEASTPVLDTVGTGGAELDEEVLTELETYGFPRNYAVRCLELNKHNHITTTYWLLQERKRRVLEQIDHVMVDVPLDVSARRVAEPPTTHLPDPERDRGTPLDGSTSGRQTTTGCYGSPRRHQAASSARGPREPGPAAGPTALPVAAWNAGVRGGAPSAWNPGSTTPTGLPAPSPDGSSRGPALGSVSIGVAAMAPWGAATAAPAIPHRRESKSRTAPEVPSSVMAASFGAGHTIAALSQMPAPADRGQSATPHAGARLYDGQARTGTTTPRGQALTARAYTPQSVRGRRQPPTQPFTAPATHRTPSPLGTLLPAGVAARPIIASPRRPVIPAAVPVTTPTPTSIRVAPSALTARASQSSRPTWR